MTAARSQLVDVNVTCDYHCIARCVHQAFICGEGFAHRKQWIEERLQMLLALRREGLWLRRHGQPPARPGAVGAGRRDGWSAEEVARRWLVAYPPKSADGQPIEINQAWIDDLAGDERRVDVLRTRLGNLGWFMKALKEPLARMANKEDDCKGPFWQSRFRAVRLMDEAKA